MLIDTTRKSPATFRRLWIGTHLYHTHIDPRIRVGYGDTYANFAWTHALALTVEDEFYCDAHALRTRIVSYLRTLALVAQSKVPHLWVIEWGRGGRIHAHLLLHTDLTPEGLTSRWGWGSAHAEPLSTKEPEHFLQVIRYQTKSIADYVILEGEGEGPFNHLYDVSSRLDDIRHPSSLASQCGDCSALTPQSPKRFTHHLPL
jgi:hypothetical protein